MFGVATLIFFSNTRGNCGYMRLYMVVSIYKCIGFKQALGGRLLYYRKLHLQVDIFSSLWSAFIQQIQSTTTGSRKAA